MDCMFSGSGSEGTSLTDNKCLLSRHTDTIVQRECASSTSVGAEHTAVGDKPTQEEEGNLLQAAMLNISDLSFRLDETQMVSRFLAEENDKLATELSEARASQAQLESRVRELEATLKEWENGGEETWWEEEQSRDKP